MVFIISALNILHKRLLIKSWQIILTKRIIKNLIPLYLKLSEWFFPSQIITVIKTTPSIYRAQAKVVSKNQTKFRTHILSIIAFSSFNFICLRFNCSIVSATYFVFSSSHSNWYSIFNVTKSQSLNLITYVITLKFKLFYNESYLLWSNVNPFLLDWNPFFR